MTPAADKVGPPERLDGPDLGLAMLAIGAGSMDAFGFFATSTQAQGPVTASADLNQTAISQIINQLDQRQFQLSVAAAQTSAQRSLFVPRITSIGRAK
jgi:hypothetical protein